MQRIPVQNPDGTPAMPTKSSRAQRWVAQGKAQWVKTNLRSKAVRLKAEPSGRNTQPIVVGVDPGTLYSGIAVQSAQATLFQSHLELPYPKVRERMDNRRQLHLMVPRKKGLRRKYGGTVTRHGFRKGDLVRAEMAGRVSVGYVSGDTTRQVSVSEFTWKRIGQFSAAKVELLYRATGILVSCPQRLSVSGAFNPAA